MRVGKSWIVAKKDMAEFKTNKYIIFSLVLMPTIMGILIPVSYFLPIQLFIQEESGPPLPIELANLSAYYDGELSNVTLTFMHLENVTVSNSVIESSFVSNSTLLSVVVNNSELDNVSVIDSIISNSNIYNLILREDTLVKDSVIVKERDSETKEITLQMLNFMLFFYVIVPAAIPTLIASYSFVGEKNNRSLEPLLATPTTDLELLMGKTLAIFITTMLATWASYLISAVFINALSFPMLGYYPLPNPVWIIGFTLLAPIFCILSISLNVLISSKVTDVRASQQIGGLVVLPVLTFLFLTFVGPAFSSAWMMLAYSAIFLAIDLLLIRLSIKIFRREEILTKWK
ncbi:MAG: ABC transporter permease subunit [Thermoplasmata archaeon]